MKILREAEARLVGLAAIQAVAFIEGWDGNEHDAARFADDPPYIRPSTKFIAELKRQLRRYGFVIQRD